MENTINSSNYIKQGARNKLIIFIVFAALAGCALIAFSLLLALVPRFYWVGLLALVIFALLTVYYLRKWLAYRHEHAEELGLKSATEESRAISRAKWEQIKQEQEEKAERRRAEHRASKRHPNKISESKLDLALNIINIILLVGGVIIILFPLLNYFSLAFNDGNHNIDVVIVPVKPTFKAVQYILAGDGAAPFWRAFGNSVVITLIVTIGSNLVEAMAAYQLSKQDCPFRSGILMFFIITMLFSAGIIPIYLVMHMFHLLDTIWSIILISISNVTHLLYFKTFFEGVSSDIEEAARLDGASDLQLFFRIIVPMAMPVIGSCCFFTIVGTWNSYGSAMLFIGQTEVGLRAQPLAYYIYLMLRDGLLDKNNVWLSANGKNVEAAAMLASIIPILLLYPYVVRYIKSGIQVGSVKG